jgi:hypothetical protein
MNFGNHQLENFMRLKTYIIYSDTNYDLCIVNAETKKEALEVAREARVEACRATEIDVATRGIAFSE